MENENSLQHHGVKGMKWGVRKARPSSGSSKGRTTAKKKKTSSSITTLFKKKKAVKKTAEKKTEEPKKKSVKEMSDAELREAINRMNLEKQYRDLHPQQVSKGKKFADRVLNNIIIPAGEDVAKQLVKSGMTKAVNKVLDLDDEFKVYTNNKKN